jgi:hypothetical protein
MELAISVTGSDEFEVTPAPVTVAEVEAPQVQEPRIEEQPETPETPEGQEEEGKSKAERQAEGKRVERKIGKLYKSKVEAEQRAAQAEAELSRLKAQMDEFRKKNEGVDLDGLDFDQRTKHVSLQAVTEHQAQIKEEALKAELQQAREFTWMEKVDKAVEIAPDYLQTIQANPHIFSALPETVQGAILEAEHGPLLAYELAKNPELAPKLASANPLIAAQALLKLEQQIEGRIAQAQAPVTQAPAAKVAPTPTPAHVVNPPAQNFWDLPMEEIMRVDDRRKFR